MRPLLTALPRARSPSATASRRCATNYECCLLRARCAPAAHARVPVRRRATSTACTRTSRARTTTSVTISKKASMPRVAIHKPFCLLGADRKHVSRRSPPAQVRAHGDAARGGDVRHCAEYAAPFPAQRLQPLALTTASVCPQRRAWASTRPSRRARRAWPGTRSSPTQVASPQTRPKRTS